MSYTNLVIIFKKLVIIEVVRIFNMQKKSKISIFIIGLVIVLTSIGLSYAYWKTTIMGDKGNNDLWLF